MNKTNKKIFLTMPGSLYQLKTSFSDSRIIDWNEFKV